MKVPAEELSVADTNREKALRGEVVRVSDSRLVEMQIQAIQFEGVTPNPVYHWHWAAVLNELAALRKIVAKLGEIRGIDLGYSQSDALKCPACGEIGCGPGCSGGIGSQSDAGGDSK
jgi:hypothetical protein